MSKTTFKELMKGGLVVMPGAFSALTAKLAQGAGFRALYVSGAGLANGLGLPDIGLTTMTEVLTQAKYIIDAVKIPCLVDADTGFGETANVERVVRELEAMGAGGLHLEDQELPKKCGHLSGKTLIEPGRMAEKIQAAVRARRGGDFMIAARTDAASIEGLEGAVQRARLYIEAGADAVFPEALESREAFRTFKKEVPAPLIANMTEFGRTPYITVEEFEAMGYSMVLFPLTAMRVMLKSVKLALERLRDEGGQEGFLEDMYTREELYKLLGYAEFLESDRELAGGISVKKGKGVTKKDKEK